MVSLSKATSLSLTSFSGALPSFIFTASAVSRASGGLYAGSRLNISAEAGLPVAAQPASRCPSRAGRRRRAHPWPPGPSAAWPAPRGAPWSGPASGTGAGTTGAADAGAIPASTGTAARPAAPASTRRRDTDVSATVAAPPLNGHPPIAATPPAARAGAAREPGKSLGSRPRTEQPRRRGAGTPNPGDRPQCGRHTACLACSSRYRSAASGTSSTARGRHPLAQGAGGRDVVGVVLQQPPRAGSGPAGRRPSRPRRGTSAWSSPRRPRGRARRTRRRARSA